MNMFSVLLTLIGVMPFGFSNDHSIAALQEVVQPASTGEAPPMLKFANEHSHHSTSPGKPAAAIRLHSEPVHRVSLYENKKLAIVLQNSPAGGAIDIEARVDHGLLLLSPTQWSVSAENALITLPVELEAQRDGVHHLHLLIQHRDDDGVTTARALAVQINVGEVADVQLFSKQGATQPTIIQLHAEEEIF